MRVRIPILCLAAAGLLHGAPPSSADFELDPRLEIRLWAAEPDVIDPVALAFDENGRAFVAECRDYPYGTGPDGKVGSTIRLLEDRDGDGRADRSTVFARDLSYATSVTPWRGGVLVTAAPDLLFLKDTDGDGIADVRTVLVTGFTRGVSDSLVNGLRFGPDNRIHGANGGNGGRLSIPGASSSALALGDSDFSLDPDTGDLRLTGRTGGGFGLVFDDWGRAFTTYNIDHIQHRYLDHADYAGQAGYLGYPTTTSISDHGDMAPIFPISAAQTRPNHPEQSGHFSAAGGMGHLGSDAWPADLRGAIFVCDVVGNLVHREVIAQSGASLVARRDPQERDREFLASRDPHFRPVGLEMGPDGALYLLDMQREVIEHPDYIPTKVRGNIRAGDDRGRIWRITPKGQPRPTRVGVDLTRTENLVPLLAHGDQWWRVTAQRLLIERRATNLAPRIRSLLSADSALPRQALGHVHALWTLHGLGQLQANDLRTALTHRSPAVRQVALQLVRPGLGPLHATLAPAVRERMTDPDARVRFHAALALRGLDAPDTVSDFPNFLKRNQADPWVRRAALLGMNGEARIKALGLLLIPASSPVDEPNPAALAELAEAVAADPAGNQQSLALPLSLLKASTPTVALQGFLDGLARGFARRDPAPEWSESIRREWARIAAFADPRSLASVWRTWQLGGGFSPDPARLAAARSAATNATMEVGARADHIRLLAFDAAPVPLLLDLLDAREPAGIQSVALELLRQRREPGLGTDLVARWRSLPPPMRSGVLGLLLERRPYHDALLSALEGGRITPGELNLDLEQRRRLLRGGTRETAARATRFFGDEEYSNRKKVVEDWLAKLPAKGDPARGRVLFTEACAQCHRSADLGQQVGPDLSGVAHRSVEDLLGNILDPNMAINPGFVSYVATTRDGETHSGLLLQSGTDPILLVQAAGQRVTLPRRDVVRLESTGSSLMPEGLEAGRTPQDLRDLIAFLQGAR